MCEGIWVSEIGVCDRIGRVRGRIWMDKGIRVYGEIWKGEGISE